MTAAQHYSGVGSPEGIVFADPGDIYQDETGKFWLKESGTGTNTGWSQVAPSTAVFVPGAGAGSGVQNNGSGNTATGVNALAEGNTTTASAIGAHAEGDHTIAANDGAHAEGTTTQALADASHAEGSNTVVQNGANAGHVEGFNNTVTAAAFAGHAEGQNNTASGTASHAEGGNGTTASGSYAHAQNLTTHASGDASFARGVAGTASGDESSVFGIQGVALRESQQTLSGGHFAVNGDGQSSRLVLRGTTPGAAPNESVELKFGFGATPTDELLLENGKAYAFKIRVIAYATSTDFASFESSLFSANQEAGVITIKPNPPVAIPLI